MTTLSFADGDPFSLFSASGQELLLLTVLLPVAVFVFWFGRREVIRRRGEYALRPTGRIFRESASTRDEAWRKVVSALEAKPPTPIASANRQTVRFEGTLTAASGNLGGAKGRECIWRNRAGARRESAVGADMVILADSTGRAGIEGVERAYVIAPTDRHTLHHENISLYLGDRVEIYGQFEPEAPQPAAAEPSMLVYGTLGTRGPLEVRLIERPPPSDSSSDDDSSS